MESKAAEQTISLLDQIKRVAEARNITESLRQERSASLAQWEMDNDGLLSQLKDHTEACQQEEALLRELTIKAYQETGSKAPAPGVGIRERIVLQYDGKVAFDWAKAHKIALMLDTKAFEKIAKAGTPEFVSIRTELQATISQDLTKILNGDTL